MLKKCVIEISGPKKLVPFATANTWGNLAPCVLRTFRRGSICTYWRTCRESCLVKNNHSPQRFPLCMEEPFVCICTSTWPHMTCSKPRKCDSMLSGLQDVGRLPHLLFPPKAYGVYETPINNEREKKNFLRTQTECKAQIRDLPYKIISHAQPPKLISLSINHHSKHSFSSQTILTIENKFPLFLHLFQSNLCRGDKWPSQDGKPSSRYGSHTKHQSHPPALSNIRAGILLAYAALGRFHSPRMSPDTGTGELFVTILAVENPGQGHPNPLSSWHFIIILYQAAWIPAI